MADHSDFDPSSKHEEELKTYKRKMEKKKNEAHDTLTSAKHLKQVTEHQIAFKKKRDRKVTKLNKKNENFTRSYVIELYRSKRICRFR